MSFPGVVLEVELEALINEVLGTVSKIDSEPSLCYYNDNMLDFYSRTREIEFPSYRSYDDERTPSFGNCSNMRNLSEQASTFCDPLYQQASNGPEQAYVQPMEEEDETAREVKFKDALLLLEEAAGFMIIPEDACTNQELAEVNLSEGGLIEEWEKENLDLDFEVISQGEMESMRANMQELDEIIESLYNEGTDNSENLD